MTRFILAGTIALMIASTAAMAADSEAARLQKLESAVSQLQQENASLKKELHAQEATDFASSPAAKIKMSDSITELKIYGEARLRYFMNEGMAAGTDAGDTGQRERLRYRLRLGADIKLQENWMAGILLETNTSPRSANVTLGENPVFAKATVSSTSVLTGSSTTSGTFVTGINPKTGKPVTGKALTTEAVSKGAVVSNVNFGDALFVGRAFLRYAPTDWLTINGGKILNPFVTTRMVWDPDINPEGFSEQFKFTLGGSSGARGPEDKTETKTIAPKEGMTVDLFGNFGQFIYNDVGFENNFNTGTGPFSQVPNATDRWMLGWQLGAKVNITKEAYVQLAPAFYNYTGGGTSSVGPFNGDNAIVILDNHAKPALVTFNQTGVNGLAVLEVPVEIAWKMFNT